VLIEGAAAGNREDREEFARRYEPAVRAYLGARWNGTDHASDIDDAVQEVFLECFRTGGVLERADPDRPGGFRAFLYAVARNVALRLESRRARQMARQAGPGLDPDQIASRERTLSNVFDHAWARSRLREAFALLAENAHAEGESAERRVELLRMHFEQDLALREIARRWDVDEKALYREFDRAKREYRAALEAVVALCHSGTPGEIERECAELVGLVSRN
jgi:RNA polymerase sigma-70 factor (ECF subfamily)